MTEPRKFTYNPDSSWGFVFLMLFGAGIATAGMLFEFDLAYRNLTVLTFPTSRYAVLGVGALFTVFGLKSLLQSMALRRLPRHLLLTPSSLSLPQPTFLGAEMKTVAFADADEFYVRSDDDGTCLVISLKSGGPIEVEADCMDQAGFAEVQSTVAAVVPRMRLD